MLLSRFGFMFPLGIIFSHAFQIKVCDRFLAMNLRTYQKLIFIPSMNRKTIYFCVVVILSKLHFVKH